MDVIKYLEKYIKIELSNGFYYQGLVVGYDEDSLNIIDKFGKSVTVLISLITFIKEVEKK